ncbi:sigma factor G inhibitor Gin [Salibacterium halotolerans]|uniref:Inhibitor of sigma-G Gin n=1 Tax=Salibacterium halotolerans TaxID=1884432 RepID=A0A1I5WNH6_9BACI|nr:sigma factor G inhibitor Gin [Salibacterium halotolerans]SFQ21354.1 Inhibitor of sigma-G Gin [Salibacterium halotolerans]
MEKERQAESCTLCGRTESRGIHILDIFLCLDCEKELIQMEAEDTAYHRAVKTLSSSRASKLLM